MTKATLSYGGETVDFSPGRPHEDAARLARRAFSNLLDTRSAIAGDEASPDSVDRVLGQTAPARQTVEGSDPKRPAFVPADDAFGEDGDFLEADTDVGSLVRLLIGDDPDTLIHLGRLTFRCLWQRVGGKAAGVPLWGKMQRPGKLYRHLAAGADYFLILFADNLRDAGLSNLQFEAFVYSKLCECAVDPETGKPAIKAPDFVGFVAELERYGAWCSGLQRASRALKQLPLALAEVSG